MKKIVSLLSFFLLCGSAYALPAPGAGIPAVFITSPTGSEQINVYGVGPQIQTIYLSQARDSSGYFAMTEGATNTITVRNTHSVIALHGPTAGTATVIFPPAPSDGQRLRVFSTAGVTTLTLTPSPGQTVDNAATVIAANGAIEYIYQLSTKTWFRIL
jgi:hypothetical protein